MPLKFNNLEQTMPRPEIRMISLLVIVSLLFVNCAMFLATPRQEEAVRERGAADAVGLCIEEEKVISIFEKNAPSVAFITSKVRRRNIFSLNVTEIARGSGSGFIWDRDGHVVTNYHVIQDADAVCVTLADKSVWPAKIVGTAADKDLAVLQIEAPESKLVPISVGSSSQLKVGQTVLAIGNPFGLDHSLSKGVISARGREIKATTGRIIRDVIQTDAAINPGNSGGPLLDSGGRLVGIATAIVSPSGSNAGIGFAVPVDTVRRSVPQLIEHGRVILPGPAGVIILPESYTHVFNQKGAVILAVRDESPAHRIGLEGVYYNRRGRPLIGDVITAVDGQPVRNLNDYYSALERFKPGDKVTLTIKRGRGLFETEIDLVESRE